MTKLDTVASYSSVLELASELGLSEKACSRALQLADLGPSSSDWLRYRKRGESVRLASDAYFFEEGSWKDYSRGRFGEIRINNKGDAVLTGLMDEWGNRLGPALH